MAENKPELLIEWYKPDKKKLAEIRELYNYLTVETCYKEYNIKHNVVKRGRMKPVFEMPPDFQRLVRSKLNKNNRHDNPLYIEANKENGDVKICYAQVNEKIIGFEMIETYYENHSTDSARIEGIYIMPQYRDGSISYLLNEAVEQYCKSIGKRYIYNETTDPRNANLYSMKEGGNYSVIVKDVEGVFYLKKDLVDKDINAIEGKKERQK